MSTDSRIGSLSSILAGERPRRAATSLKRVTIEPEATSETASDVADAVVEAAAPRRRPPASQRTPAARTGVRRRVVCRVPQDTHDRLADYARRRNISHGAVVLQAVEKAHVDAAFTEEASSNTHRESALFIGTNVAQTKLAAAKVVLDVRLHMEDIEVLHKLVVEHGTRDRTDLINQALAHFFAQDADA